MEAFSKIKKSICSLKPFTYFQNKRQHPTVYFTKTFTINFKKVTKLRQSRAIVRKSFRNSPESTRASVQRPEQIRITYSRVPGLRTL